MTDPSIFSSFGHSSEQILLSLVASADDSIIVTDTRGNILFANAATAALLGVGNVENLANKSIFEFITSESLYEIRQNMQLAINRETVRNREYELFIAEKRLQVEMTISVLRDSPGDSMRFLMIAHDISSRKKQERQREAIAGIALALRGTTSRKFVVETFLMQVNKLLGVEDGAIGLLRYRQNEVMIEAATGEFTHLLGEKIPVQPDFSGPAFQYDREVDVEIARALRMTTWKPLEEESRKVGVLLIKSPLPLDSDQQDLLTAVASLGASSIRRVTLFEETQMRLQRLSTLRTISISIGASLELGVTIKVLLDQMTAQLHADAADILLVNPHTQILEFTAGRGFRLKSSERVRFRLGEGLAGRVSLERRLMYIPDLNQAVQFLPYPGWMAGESFVSYYGVPLIVKGQVKGVLETFHRTRQEPDPEWAEFLEALAAEAAIALDNAELFDKLQRANVDLRVANDAAIEGWARAIELREREAKGHTDRVAEWTVRLAQMSGFRGDDLVHIRRGALLHDIGKMAVPDRILLKTDPLSDEEWEIIRQHPDEAYDILYPIPFLRPAIDIPYCHHERWNGGGYPRGLKGVEIPLPARIFAVVDVWDILSHDYPHRAGWEEKRVIGYLQEEANRQFDPKVVEDFLALLKIRNSKSLTSSAIPFHR